MICLHLPSAHHHPLQGTQNEQLWAVGKYAYDAFNQRIHLGEMGTFNNASFTYNALMLFQEVHKPIYTSKHSNKCKLQHHTTHKHKSAHRQSHIHKYTPTTHTHTHTHTLFCKPSPFCNPH